MQLKNQISILEKDLNTSNTARKKEEQNRMASDSKLTRVLNDMQKLKDQITTLKTEKDEVARSAEIDNQDTRAHVKKLTKQCQNLENIIKKQSQLIEVLKRQKLHLEASKAVEFSESNFIKLFGGNN